MLNTGKCSMKKVVLLLSLTPLRFHSQRKMPLSRLNDTFASLAVDQPYYLTDAWHAFAPCAQVANYVSTR
eukprot:12920630-Prorocentrum_lima.AAC.1